MSDSKAVPVLVTYRPKPGKEDDLLALVQKHWPALSAIGLVTSDPARLWRATDKRSQKVYFVEMFEWKDGSASDVAHQTPEVMAIWEPMGAVLESLEIAHLDQL